MLTLKIKYANGDINLTRMNATVEEAKAYYIGKTFNIGVVSDDLQKCVGIEVLEDITTYNCPDIGKFGAGSTPATTLSSFPGPQGDRGERKP